MSGSVANGRQSAGPRCIALVGPFQSGKTSLMEALLARMGAIQRQGSVTDGSSVGDSSAEARSHAMSVEPNIATADFMGERFTFIDCPGSIEFLHEMRHIAPACDAAVVVCEADEKKIPQLALILRELEEAGVPRFLFLNKIDAAQRRVRETLQMLQPASRTPLLLRQIPIWKNGIAVGFIDLALERAFIYREHAPSEVLEIPGDESPREKEARYSMLEKLADYDDALMEDLLSDIEPPRDRVFDDLSRELREGHVAPVLIGAAERGNGVTRLLKALRHEAPDVMATRGRLGVDENGEPLAQVMRTLHTSHGGKLSIARVLRGTFRDNDTIVGSGGQEARIAGVSRLTGASVAKVGTAEAGDTVAFGRLDPAATGDAIAVSSQRPSAILSIAPPEAVHTITVAAKDRKDEVRLSAALNKLVEEDTSLSTQHVPELGEFRLHGQGEMHLRVAMERLEGRFGVTVTTGKPSVGYRETIRHKVSERGRHRKQSGGHGQFGDVVMTVEPLARGEGVQFKDTITGGVVPKQYIPSVEEGFRAYCARGPLGFPVVDVQATLTDGSYHTVDSSDMAFQQAARLAMTEAMPKAKPVLLEPIMAVEILTPSEGLSRASAMITARRGQILGYDSRPGWEGWDVLRGLVPESEMGGLIVELRSATSGVATFTAQFDHLAELTGKPADHVVQARAQERAH
ncbi:elongation factor G [Terrarubrum flagellatum]|uniref:elongation factor G n=1 Tax=Terrirubrum flagellatum TaxID=2895980 RepID=UPI0031450B8C